MTKISNKISFVIKALRNGFYDFPGEWTYDEDEGNDSFGAVTWGYAPYKIHVRYQQGYVSCFLAYGKCEIPVGPAERPLAELEPLLAEVKAELRLRLGHKFVPREYKLSSKQIFDAISEAIPMDVAANNFAIVMQKYFGSNISGSCSEVDNYYSQDYRLFFNIYDTYPVTAYGNHSRMGAGFTCLERDQEGATPVFSYGVKANNDSFDLDGFARQLKREVESRLPDKFLGQRAAAGEARALVTAPGEENAPSGPKEFKQAAAAFFGSRFADGHACWGAECHRLLHPVDDVGNRRAYGLFNPPPELAEDPVAGYRAFAVRFAAYATVPVVLVCREGMLNAYLYYGKYLVPLNPRRLPMPATRVTEFFRLVKKELELRLPDEFLAKYGWLE